MATMQDHKKKVESLEKEKSKLEKRINESKKRSEAVDSFKGASDGKMLSNFEAKGRKRISDKMSVIDKEISKEQGIIEACSDLSSRELFSKAKKAFVQIKLLIGVILGFAGAGKTHTLTFLLGEDPPSMRVSTALTGIPVRAMGLTRMAVDSLTKMGADKTKFKRVSDDKYSAMVVKTAKDEVAKSKQETTFFTTALGGLRKFVFAPDNPKDEIEEDLIIKFHHMKKDERSLENQVILEMSDCGGQPQFLEILPRFLESSISLGILVHDLSQSLDDYPINYYYNRDGVSVGEGVKSPLTNEQVLRLCLQMIASRCRGGKRVRFVFVGTHRDLEAKCAQSRDAKNRRLMEMVESFNLEDCVIYRNHQINELIFAVNAKTPEEVDQQTMGELRELLMDESAANVLNIPFSYHGLELTLKKKVRESGQIAFREADILKEVSHYEFTEESLKDALRYLHDIKMIFYYEKEFPGVVIGEPQSILNKHTEVVAYHIELTTNPKMQKGLHGIWKKFKECGILSVECLKKFPAHYVEGVFSPADMMRLFEKLLIVSEVGKGEYLMPCVLPVEPHVKLNTEPDTQSVPPMVLQFPEGAVRYGIFCATICHVMTQSKWELFKKQGSKQPLHLTRNSVHFSVPGFRGRVTLNDSFGSLFLVTVHGPSDVPEYSDSLPALCAEIRDTLISAIEEVTGKLNYSPDKPEVAFMCEEHKLISIHGAMASKTGKELLCSKDRNLGFPIQPQHRVWLQGSQSFEEVLKMPYSSYIAKIKAGASPSSVIPLELKALQLLKWKDEKGVEQKYRLVEKVSSKWRDFALRLLNQNTMEALEDDVRDSGKRWIAIMKKWLESGGTPDYWATWEGLCELLEDLGYQTYADELQEVLSSSPHL